MNKLQFGKLIAYICFCAHKGSVTEYDVSELDILATPAVMPAPQADARDVVALMHALMGQRKIDAIKAYRTLTGHGLKESKDAVEAALAVRKADLTYADTHAPSNGYGLDS